MTEADLGRIEAAIGSPLPAHYRDFLRDHSDTLRGTKARFPMMVVLQHDPEVLIRDNAPGSRPRMWVGEHLDWPEEFFRVGTNGGGDYWFVNLDSPRERVWLYASEGGCIVPPEFFSWDEYLEQLDDGVGLAEREASEAGGSEAAAPGTS